MMRHRRTKSSGKNRRNSSSNHPRTGTAFDTSGCEVQDLNLVTTNATGSVAVVSFEASFTITPIRRNISISVAANAAHDFFGNGNEASNEIFYPVQGYVVCSFYSLYPLLSLSHIRSKK